MRRKTLDGLRELNEMNFKTVGDDETHTRIQQYELAFRMQSSVPDLTDLKSEPESTYQLYGEEAKPEIERIRAELFSRLGEARARRVADTNRNLVVFPNLVVNDGSSVTIRTFHPIAPDRMQVRAWALGSREETAQARAIRLDSFLTFYGPGGFATPGER